MYGWYGAPRWLIKQFQVEESNNSHIAKRLTSGDRKTGIPCERFKTFNNTEKEKLIFATYCHHLLIPHVTSSLVFHSGTKLLFRTMSIFIFILVLN